MGADGGRGRRDGGNVRRRLHAAPGVAEHHRAEGLRYIDWNIYARTDEVLLKIFREEENLQLSVFVDCSASMDFGTHNKFDYARMVAGALSYIGLANLDSVNLMSFAGGLGDHLRGSRGRPAIFRVLKFIERLEPGKETGLAAALQQFMAMVRRRGVQIVLSDFYAFDEVVRSLRALAFHQNDVFLIHVVDPWEEDPDLAGELRLQDVELGDSENLSVTRPLVRRYREAFAEHVALVERTCRQNEWGYLLASTAVPYDELILRMLRKKELVG
ncbi:MAG: DUF58 domain-containing protein [Planctomycetota bacterium]